MPVPVNPPVYPDINVKMPEEAAQYLVINTHAGHKNWFFLQKWCKIHRYFKKEEDKIMWAYESVFYKIYPLGFAGAPFENDGQLEHRILKVIDWIPHMKKLGINAIYFSPVFESDTHGYNTRDYTKIDCRLGTNEDFAKVCKALHEEGSKSF